MTKLLAVGLGGFVGALARYGLSELVNRLYQGHFPLGTLVVNLLGCVAIGVCMTLVEERELFSANIRLFLMIGLLGSLTTFSTFGHETFALLRDGRSGVALANVMGSVLLGLAGVLLGRAIVRWAIA